MKIFLLLLPLSLWANDAVYYGAGSSLSLLENKQLRVIREDLVLTALPQSICYQLLYKGKPVKKDEYPFPVTAEENEAEFYSRTSPSLTPGKPVNCKSSWRTYEMSWRAQAEYRVEAAQAQRDVLIGFPAPTRGFDFIGPDGLESVSAVGIANFRTFNGVNLIKNWSWKWVPLREYTLAERKRGEEGYHENQVPAPVWALSFDKGKKVVLTTKYDFAASLSAGFNEGREYSAGKPPWFVDSGIYPDMAGHLIYHLTPLSSWAAQPPERIFIRVNLPKDLPAVYAVPIAPKPSCIGRDFVYYEFKDTFPDEELELSFPVGPTLALKKGWKSTFMNIPKFKPIETAAEWNAWREATGEPKLTCHLTRQIDQKADKDLKAALKGISCVSSCGKNSLTLK